MNEAVAWEIHQGLSVHYGLYTMVFTIVVLLWFVHYMYGFLSPIITGMLWAASTVAATALASDLGSYYYHSSRSKPKLS